jgi:hypothetical protein
LAAAEGKRAGSQLLFGLIVEFMDKEGRIPTPSMMGCLAGPLDSSSKQRAISNA